MAKEKKVKRKSKTTDPLVIVGNGMVSWRFCQKLVAEGIHSKRKIIVFGEEPHAAYDRVNLTKYVNLDSLDSLLLSPLEWYAAHGIDLHLGVRIHKLDTGQKLVVDADGQTYAYGDCVLATGSRAFVPPIDGVDSENVFVYRTAADIDAIKAATAGAKRGLVIGGGLLGLEAANVLRDCEIDTCIVQAANTLMSRQLNEDGGSFLLKEVAKLGMTVKLLTFTESIQPTDLGLEVSFNKGDSLLTDLVIVAAGIAPNDELAKDAGLETAIRGGIIVNDRLQTKDPHVYAIGECVSHRGHVYGLVAPGYDMADTLAGVFAGQKTKYTGSDESCRLKLLGVEVSVFGDYMQDGQYHVYRGENCYRAIVIRDKRIVGATVVGEWKQTVEIERAVRENQSISKSRIEVFEREGDLFEDLAASGVLLWPDTSVVCNCTNTTCGALKQAVIGGCQTVEQLTDTTGAGGVCGSCLPQLAEFVGESSSSFIDTGASKGKWLLWAAALVALVFGITMLVVPPLPVPDTVQSGYYEFTQIWTESLTKQITGYTIAGISILALLLSARKRIKFLSFGNYGFWRAVHSWFGVITMVGIFMHTGLNFGENLNLWLLICFLGLNLAGALAAVSVAAEKRFSGRVGARLRGIATKAHIVFFMPYPVLLGFHIAKVYIY